MQSPSLSGDADPTPDAPSEQSATVTRPVISQTYADLEIPGVVIEVDQTTADKLGAFEEDALSFADAWDANSDLAEDGGTDDGTDE